MPELTARVIVLLVCVGLFTAAAAIIDFKTRRLSNKLTVPFFLVGLIYQMAFNGTAGLADAGQAFLAGFGTLFLLWIVGGGGGGDVKMMGALSVWLGFETTLLVLIGSTAFVILGTGVVVLYSLFQRGIYGTKSKYLAKSITEGRTAKLAPETVDQRTKRRVMPYAVPVCFAVWAVLFARLDKINAGPEPAEEQKQEQPAE